MKKKQLFLLHVEKTTNVEASSLFNLTIDVAVPVRAEIGDMANAALTELETNATAFRAQINRPQKNPLTDQLNAERKVCVNVFSEIKKIVTFESSSRNELRKKAATDLNFFFKPNWDIMKSSIGDQIDQTVEIMLKYAANPGLQSAAQTIAVDTLMTELEADNTALNTTFKVRNLEEGKKGPSGSDLRPAATDSFIRFSNIIEQAANYTPNPAILELFTKMNELRKRYHALIPSKKDKGTTPSA